MSANAGHDGKPDMQATDLDWPLPYTTYSEDAMILARLLDGKLRRPDGVCHASQELTDEDIALAEELLYTLSMALQGNNREVLDQVGAARDLLMGVERGVGPTLARYVHAIRTFAAHRRDALRHRVRPPLVVMRESLAKHYDPAFAGLTLERLDSELDSVSEDPKGGAGRRGPVAVAARLAVSVGAFDFGSMPGTYGERVKKASARLETLVAKQKRKEKSSGT
ncbi:hypothetical protein [Sorangium sp. So ce128]|uniref:hypothetical protein n=1 Tax=Sorangium sp. So ce128 TaxID=3133281 RepID=UPI003F6116F3